MNDKDREAFEKWMKNEDRHDGVFGNNNNFTRDEWVADKAWQAACEYKQKEIQDIISFQNAEIIELNKKVSDQDDEYIKDVNYLDAKIRKLQAENEELKKQIYVEGSIHKQGDIQREMTWKESSDMMERIVESRTRRLEESIKSVTKLKAELREYKEAASSEAAFVDELQAENAKLRECVEFYADRFSWTESEHPTHEYYAGSIRNDDSLVEYTEADGDVFKDFCGGKRARKVLKELEGK